MDPVTAIAQIVALGFILEAVVETIKLAYEPETRNVDRFVALAFGIAGAVAFNFSLLRVIGFADPVIPFFGEVITGFALARGGNFIHNLITRSRGGEPVTAQPNRPPSNIN